MHPIRWAALAGSFFLMMSSFAPAEENKELQALIDKVLKAHGGETKLSQLEAFIEKTRTTGPKGQVTTMNRYVHLPDKLRMESEFDVGDKRVKCAIIYNGNQGWKKQEDKATELRPSPFTGVKDPQKFSGPRIWLRLRDPAYTPSLLEETKVGDRPAVGIKLSGKGREERLFFDKQTRLLLKAEETLTFGQGKEAITVETLYSDYQEIAGIPIAHKTTKKTKGEVTSETEVVEFKVADKLDEKLFGQP